MGNLIVFPEVILLFPGRENICIEETSFLPGAATFMESVDSALTRDMMRGNTRGGLLMKKSATEGVFFARLPW